MTEARAAIAAGMLLTILSVQSPAQTTDAQTTDTLRPFLWQSRMTPSDIGEVNVFRRFSSDRLDAMTEFYRDVLALPVLPDAALGAGRMIRYPLGGSEVKLFPVAPSAANTAAVGEAIGLRLLTFFYADRADVTRRFVEHGYPAPEFRDFGGNLRALVQDPDGEWVELAIVPDARPEDLARFEIGIAVGDLDASRAFYRDLMGLDEQPPVRDELLGAVRHAYTHRATTINLWAVDDGLPKDVETGGIQYIVWDVAGLNDVAVARGAAIDRPLSEPGTMRTVWLTDPDGVSNYFAEFSGNDNEPPGAH